MSSDEEEQSPSPPAGQHDSSPGISSKGGGEGGRGDASSSSSTSDTGDVNLLSRVFFRPVRPTDIPECHDLESASYPDDEAASKSMLQYRQHHAAKYFRCAVLAEEPQQFGTVDEKNGTAVMMMSPGSVGQHEAPLVGFVCATRCRQFRAESMSTHVPDGELLAIHSVVVSEPYRRRGVATAMMRDYLTSVVDDTLSKIVLLAKKHMLSFYVDCGFTVTRSSPISHGKETWYELELDLAQQRRDRDGCPCYVVDAFASDTTDCAGNPAAVVVLDQCEGRDSAWMQRVAMEFNLSETAFLVRQPPIDSADDSELSYSIRYFTPTTEVPLCGHATLASAAVIFDTVFVKSRAETTIVFRTIENVELRANLSASSAPTPTSSPSQPKKRSYRITMEFPSKPAEPITDRTWVEHMLQAALHVNPDAVLFAGLSGTGDVLVELTKESFSSIPHSGLNLDPIRCCDMYSRGVIVCCLNRPPDPTSASASGGGGSSCSSGASSADDESRPAVTKPSTADFLSRFFGPKAGIDEDPVTGSAHCVLAPYFADKLDKDRTVGMQTSARGGIVECCLVENQSVQLTGTSIITMTGTLWL